MSEGVNLMIIMYLEELRRLRTKSLIGMVFKVLRRTIIFLIIVTPTRTTSRIVINVLFFVILIVNSFISGVIVIIIIIMIGLIHLVGSLEKIRWPVITIIVTTRVHVSSIL